MIYKPAKKYLDLDENKKNFQQKKIIQLIKTFSLLPLLFIVAAQENVLVNNSNIKVELLAMLWYNSSITETI